MIYFLVSLILGYFLLKELWMRWSYDLHKIPTAPKMPFLGHALHFVEGKATRPMNVWIRNWREKLGFPKVMQLCIMGKTMVVVMDGNLVRNVVCSKTYNISRQSVALRHVKRLFMGDDPTPSMFCTLTTTPYVKAIRKCYAASFTTPGMKKAFTKQMEVMVKGKLYLEAKQHQDTIDLQDFFTRMMLDVAGKVELDMDLGGLDKSSPLCDLLIQCGHHVWSLTTDVWLQFKAKLLPNSESVKTMKQDFKGLIEQWTKIANEVRSRSESDETSGTVADNLSKVCMPGTSDPLPFNLLRGELANAIVGGFDTVSHQLSWIFAVLATHPHVVEKLLDELKSHELYGDNARELEFEDLSLLEYLKAVISEGMRRVHTLVVVGSRTASQDLMLDGYRVPKGTILYIPSNYSMSSDAEWEDNLAFKPERWLHDNINVKDKYYFPFGYGDRECIGMKLAMQFMKVTIVYFVTRFSFELVGDTIESLVETGVAGVVFEAKNGVNMKVTARPVA